MHIQSEHSRPAENHLVFVVEGDEVVRSALQFILDDHNEVRAFSGLGPAFAGASDLQPDIVLLGIDLMQINGRQVLAHIESRWPRAKILIVANSAKNPLAEKCLKWGAHGVLGKPITFDYVYDKVDALLRQRRCSAIAVG